MPAVVHHFPTRRPLALLCVALLVLAGLLYACAAPDAQSPPPAWDEATAPNYYEVVGPARFDTLPREGTVTYSPLDGLGRAGRVEACVDWQLMQEGTQRERGDMRGIHPSGWGNNREVYIELPFGGTYHGYFWNRSHLLAKSLGGADVAQNLICGTRMQNVGANRRGAEGGMAYPETLVRDWLHDHPDGYVLYAAAPEYLGDEPVCRDVVVDVLSSDGALNHRIVVFNAAKGYDISYATGSFDERQGL